MIPLNVRIIDQLRVWSEMLLDLGKHLDTEALELLRSK